MMLASTELISLLNHDGLAQSSVAGTYARAG